LISDPAPLVVAGYVNAGPLERVAERRIRGKETLRGD
jgi:hypothetical protein